MPPWLCIHTALAQFMCPDHCGPTIPYWFKHHTETAASQQVCGTLISPFEYHPSQDQLPEFLYGFLQTIISRPKFVVKRNFKHTQFSKRAPRHWRGLNSHLASKARPILFQLITWLLNPYHFLPWWCNKDKKMKTTGKLNIRKGFTCIMSVHYIKYFGFHSLVHIIHPKPMHRSYKIDGPRLISDMKIDWSSLWAY